MVPSLSLADVEPGFVREARVRAADQEMVELTQDFIVKQAAAAAALAAAGAAHSSSNGRDAVAILRDEKARDTPRVDEQEDYSRWLEEQQALTLAMQSMYAPEEDGEEEEDVLAYYPSTEESPSGEQPTSRCFADDTLGRAADFGGEQLGEVVAVDAEDVRQLERMEAAWRQEQQVLTARRRALQALYQPGGEDGSIMELSAIQQQRHAARMVALEHQLAQTQMRNGVGVRQGAFMGTGA